MKRGFFNSNGSKSSSQTLVTHGPLPPPASSISLASKAQTCNINTLTLNSANTDEPLIKVKDDQTVTWEESPLILLADSRIEDSPYFGYFPPNSRTPEMVIIHQDLESIEQAANWEIWKKPALKQKEKIELAFEIKPSEGKGMAMIARRDIAMGELIHAERYAFTA